MLRIDDERCVACGDCVEVCPQSGDGPVAALILESGRPRVGDGAACIRCYTCVEFCRAAAIRISGADGPRAEGGLSIYPDRLAARII